MLIIFDLIGTVFSLQAMRNAFSARGLNHGLLELWFARQVQTSMACTLARKYIPFSALSRSTLEQVFAQNGMDPRHAHGILSLFGELEAWPDSLPCLRGLRTEGHVLAVLTNSGHDEADVLLERSGLQATFERVYSADDVRACKPHPAPYELVFRTMFTAPYDCCMVSAHGWDIMGAHALGASTVYVDRVEKQWPFPGSPPGLVVPSLRDVPFAVENIRREISGRAA